MPSKLQELSPTNRQLIKVRLWVTRKADDS